jgi:hypothetical protein
MIHRSHRLPAAAWLAMLPLAAAAGPRAAALPQLPPAQPASLIGSCEDLPSRLSLPDTTITGASTVPAGALTVAGQPVAAHCLLTGRTAEHFSTQTQQTYAVGWEMRMPIDWNGRFWYQGNGGIDGSVVPAIGALGGGPLTSALLQGFAVISSDAGHNNSQGGPLFGLDPQARLDYGYQAVGKLTPIAKSVIASAYGKGPDRSYIGGCSNGGRHTLVAAARYADEYDGFLAGAPGYNLPLAALANIWGAQHYANVATGDPMTPPGLETAFTATERRLVADAILARCDALDGAVDGMVQDTGACQLRFNLRRDVPTCSGDRDGTCLSADQKNAISAIFRGATTSTGQHFYARFPYDPGVAGGGVPFWEFTAPLFLDSGAVGTIFQVPPSTDPLSNGPAFSLGLDIDATLARLYATDATYTESAMAFMTPPDASNLSLLRSRGAKVLVYHGVSDPIFSVADTQAWYLRLPLDSGGPARGFARLYRAGPRPTRPTSSRRWCNGWSRASRRRPSWPAPAVPATPAAATPTCRPPGHRTARGPCARSRRWRATSAAATSSGPRTSSARGPARACPRRAGARAPAEARAGGGAQAGTAASGRGCTAARPPKNRSATMGAIVA